MKEQVFPYGSELDFSFVYELDESNLNLFFDILDLAIEAMKIAIEEDADTKTLNTKELSSDQISEMIKYFTKVLNIYTDYELFEECTDIVFILNYLESYEEKVGILQKKP